MHVRPRHDADLEPLVAALRRVHTLDGYPADPAAVHAGWLRPPRELHAWVAESGGHPAGHVALGGAAPGDDLTALWCARTGGAGADLAVPSRLFVDPAHRRRGAAELLVAAAIDHARGLGRAVALDVLARDRAAIRLYERLGAVRMGEITHRIAGRAEPAAGYAFP